MGMRRGQELSRRGGWASLHERSGATTGRTRDVGDGEVLLVVADGLGEIRVVRPRVAGHAQHADAIARECLAHRVARLEGRTQQILNAPAAEGVAGGGDGAQSVEAERASAGLGSGLAASGRVSRGEPPARQRHAAAGGRTL